MIGVRKTVAAAAIAGSMLVGGVGGAVLYSATVLTAATYGLYRVAGAKPVLGHAR